MHGTFNSRFYPPVAIRVYFIDTLKKSGFRLVSYLYSETVCRITIGRIEQIVIIDKLIGKLRPEKIALTIPPQAYQQHKRNAIVIR